MWKKGSEMIFGCAGSLRGMQLLAYNTAVPPMKKGQTVEEYLIIDFADAMKEALIHGGELQEKDGIQEHSNHFILGFEERLFTFHEDMCFVEVVEEYTAIGSGSGYALGSLYSTGKMKAKPKERIELALKAAQQFDAYVQGPYDIVSIDRANGDMMDKILGNAQKIMDEE